MSEMVVVWSRRGRIDKGSVTLLPNPSPAKNRERDGEKNAARA